MRLSIKSRGLKKQMKKRKALALVLALAMILSSFSMSFAGTDAVVTAENQTTFNDVNSHWAKDAIYKWSGNGIINGYEGMFRPDNSITRGEIAVILDNMMDYQVTAKNTFSDLKEGQFYAEAVLKANAAGIIKGDGSKVRPTDYITREEAAVILARAFGVKANTSGNPTFSDSTFIASWAKDNIKAMEDKGYVKGSNNNFMPKSNITRAEIVTMIDNIVKAYYTQAGTYSDNVNGTAIIKVSDVVLKGVTVSENLIIAEGVGQGDVTLDSTTVKGETVVRGGGENSVHITGNSNLASVTIEKIDGKIRIVVQDGSTVTELEVLQGEEIIISGIIETLNVITPNSTIILSADAKIDNIVVAESAENTTIKTESGSIVDNLTVSAKTIINGIGTVTNVALKDGADNSSVTTPKTKITVDDNVTGATGGGGVSIPGGSTGTNNSSGTNTSVVGGTTGGGSGGGGGGVTPSKPQKSVYDFTFDANNIVAGQTKITPVTLKATTVKDLGYSNAIIKVEITSKPTDASTVSLIAQDTNGNSFDIAQIGFWGPTGGFSISKDYNVPTELTATFSNVGNYVIKLSLLDVSTNTVITSKNITVTVNEPVHSDYGFIFDASNVIAGVEKLAPVTLKATTVNDLNYTNALIKVEITSKPTDNSTVSLIAQDTNGNSFDVAQIGYWGPAGGFPLSKDYNVSTDFRATFSNAGNYVIRLSLLDVSANTVITSNDFNITVIDPEAYNLQQVVNAYSMIADYQNGVLTASFNNYLETLPETINDYEIDVLLSTDKSLPAGTNLSVKYNGVSIPVRSDWMNNIVDNKIWLDEGILDIGGAKPFTDGSPGQWEITIRNSEADIENTALTIESMISNDEFVTHTRIAEATVTVSLPEDYAALETVKASYDLEATFVSNGVLTSAFTRWLDELPAGLEDYKIDVLLTLSNTLPSETDIKVTYNGAPVPIQSNWMDNIVDNKIWLGKGILDIGGAKQFTAGSPGAWEITITGNSEAIDTMLTLDSAISDDNFGSWTIIANGSVNIVLPVYVAPDVAIDNPNITGVTVPVKGVVPDTTVDETEQYTASIAWEPSADVFKGETVYTATITITPKTGYTLSDVSENFFNVAGATSTYNANSGIVTAVYPVTGALNSEARLDQLLYNSTLIEGFNADTSEYNVTLPAGTTQVPLINFNKMDPLAKVEITNAMSLPGTTTVLVTADDGITTKTYIINFTVAAGTVPVLNNLSYSYGGPDSSCIIDVDNFDPNITSYNVRINDYHFDTNTIVLSGEIADSSYTLVADAGAFIDMNNGQYSGSSVIKINDSNGATLNQYQVTFTVSNIEYVDYNIYHYFIYGRTDEYPQATIGFTSSFPEPEVQLYCNDELVPSTQYLVSDDEITFNTDYIESLSIGSYLFDAQYTNGVENTTYCWVDAFSIYITDPIKHITLIQPGNGEIVASLWKEAPIVNPDDPGYVIENLPYDETTGTYTLDLSEPGSSLGLDAYPNDGFRVKDVVLTEYYDYEVRPLSFVDEFIFYGGTNLIVSTDATVELVVEEIPSELLTIIGSNLYVNYNLVNPPATDIAVYENEVTIDDPIGFDAIFEGGYEDIMKYSWFEIQYADSIEAFDTMSYDDFSTSLAYSYYDGITIREMEEAEQYFNPGVSLTGKYIRIHQSGVENYSDGYSDIIFRVNPDYEQPLYPTLNIKANVETSDTTSKNQIKSAFHPEKITRKYKGLHSGYLFYIAYRCVPYDNII